MNQKNAPWLLLLAAAMWGSSFVASKVCLNGGMFQFETVFFRFTLGTVLTAVVFHSHLRHISGSAVRTGVILGLSTAATYALEMFGLGMTQATKGAFLVATNIVMMPFLYFLVCRVRPKLRSLAAAVLAMTGVGFLSLTNGLEAFAPGDLLLLLDAASYCVNSLLVLKFAGEDDRVQISFFQFAVTAGIMGVLAAMQGFSGSYTLPLTMAVLYQAGIPTVVCFLIKNMAIRYVDPVRCTLILSTESVFSALVARFLLHDQLSGRMLLGILLISCGVLMEVLRPADMPEKQA